MSAGAIRQPDPALSEFIGFPNGGISAAIVPANLMQVSGFQSQIESRVLCQNLVLGWPWLESARSKPPGFVRFARPSPGHRPEHQTG